MQQYCENLLTATGLNTDQYIEVVRKCPNIDKLAHLLYAMLINNLCTQENLNKLLLQVHLTEKLIDIGYLLSRSPDRLLNQENLADIFSKTPSTLDLLLSKCQEGYVLSKDGFEAAQKFVKESECLALTREKLTQCGHWNELYAQYPNQQQLWQIVDDLSKHPSLLPHLAEILHMPDFLRDSCMNMLFSLGQANIVNQENVNKIRSLRHPWKLTGALSCLQKSNQLTQEFFDKCFGLVEKVGYDGDQLTDWVELLFSSKLLTMDNLELLDRKKGLPDLLFDYRSLISLKMLDQIFLETILNHPQTSAFCHALIKLREAGLLDESSQEIVSKCADLSGLSQALQPLIDSKLFTQKNLEIITEHANPGALGEAMWCCLHSNQLNQENLAIIAEHANPGALGEALGLLNRSERFTQENFKIILEHADPGALSQALKSLKDSNFFFTKENFLAVLSHAQPHECTRALDVLKKSHKFGGEYYSAVLQHPKPYQLACAFDILLQRDFYVGDILAVSNLANPSPFLAACERLLQQNQDILDRENLHRLLEASRNEDPSALTRELNRIIQAYRIDQNQEEFNPGQSTHTKSVHSSLSESATKLNARYGKDLNEPDTIQKMRAKVHATGSQIALRCFDRLTCDEYSFVDPVSRVSVHRLLALVDKALSDELNLKNHPDIALDELNLKASPDDAFKLFLEGLHEIQRGGNLDSVGKDDENPQDSPICPGGTFNKILEKLHGIHKDVNMRYITKAGAAQRLPHLAQEHALKFLGELAKRDINEARKLIKAINKDQSLEPVWALIRDAVSRELWGEFGSAFSGQAEFELIVDSGVDSRAPTQVELEAISSAQTPLLSNQSIFQPSSNGGEDHKPEPRQ